MILFLPAALIYAFALSFYQPHPQSLKAKPLTLWENINRIKGALILGLLLLIIFFITSDFTFLETNKDTYGFLYFEHIKTYAPTWPLQAITHLFIHEDILHLLSNIIGLALLSAYERRVGTKRFLAVITIGGLVSILSILFYEPPVRVCGISGSIFALAAAFFTDHKELTLKEWFFTIAAFTLLVVVFSVQGAIEASNNGDNLQTDHIGHALGALAAIAYCRLRPLKSISG